MRVFLTGATGFLGSYLVDDLLYHGHQVAIVTRASTDLWRIAGQAANLTIIQGDLSDVAGLRPALKDFKPDSVAHLAWRGVGNIDRNRPLQARNIADTLELAELAADLGVECFVGAGSQAEYGPYSRAIDESDTANPTTLYGHAKLAAGAMTTQLCAERDIRFAWLRIFSTYGPKDAPGWLIPSMIRTLREGSRMPLTGCEQQWGFLHARDAAAAFRVALTNVAARGIFNLGSPTAPLLRDTVTMLRDLVNRNAELGFGEIAYRPDQVMILKAEVKRLAALGWQPLTDLKDGLTETVAWFDAHQRS